MGRMLADVVFRIVRWLILNMSDRSLARLCRLGGRLAYAFPGNAAKIFVNRGEGQLLRQPALMVRGGDRTTISELIQDDRREVYPAMAQNMVSAALRGKAPRSTAEQARSALRLALAAGESSRKREEIIL